MACVPGFELNLVSLHAMQGKMAMVLDQEAAPLFVGVVLYPYDNSSSTCRAVNSKSRAGPFPSEVASVTCRSRACVDENDRPT